jgi:hypothetical protein
VFYDVFQNDKVKAIWELVWGDLIDIFPEKESQILGKEWM